MPAPENISQLVARFEEYRKVLNILHAQSAVVRSPLDKERVGGSLEDRQGL
jgi:hypothetical protein